MVWLVLTLTNAISVTGRAVDEQQRPLEGVRIRVFDDIVERRHSVAETKTDEQGRYRVTGLAPDMTAYVTAQAAGRWSARAEAIALDSGVVSEIEDLRLPQVNSVISGKVTWRNAKPLAAVRVGCSLPGEPCPFESERPTTMTDSQGRYRLVGVPQDIELNVVAQPRRPGCPSGLSRKATGGATDIDFDVWPLPLWRRFLGLFRRRR